LAEQTRFTSNKVVNLDKDNYRDLIFESAETLTFSKPFWVVQFFDNFSKACKGKGANVYN
jgi:hypothetical protein